MPEAPQCDRGGRDSPGTTLDVLEFKPDAESCARDSDDDWLSVRWAQPPNVQTKIHNLRVVYWHN